jgi:hypothetical protein
MKLIYDGYRGGQVGGPTVGQQGGEAADGDGWDDAVEGDELGVSKMRRRNRTKEMSCARRTTGGRSTLRRRRGAQRVPRTCTWLRGMAQLIKPVQSDGPGRSKPSALGRSCQSRHIASSPTTNT